MIFSIIFSITKSSKSMAAMAFSKSQVCSKAARTIAALGGCLAAVLSLGCVSKIHGGCYSDGEGLVKDAFSHQKKLVMIGTPW